MDQNKTLKMIMNNKINFAQSANSVLNMRLLGNLPYQV